MQSPITIKALGIGKHVLCGAPAGPSQIDALRMVKAAHYYPKLMSLVVFGLRFLPTIAKMKQFIDKDYIGDISIRGTNDRTEDGVPMTPMPGSIFLMSDLINVHHLKKVNKRCLY
jgi:predicted dehydrogenase